MGENRNIEIGGTWANGAEYPPDTPVIGTTYADGGVSGNEIADGWPYGTIVESAKFNEVMRRLTYEILLLEKYGVMPWSALTTYDLGAWALGSDGLLYQSLHYTNNNYDPTANSYWWQEGGASLSAHRDATAVHSATAAATASRIIMRDSSGRAKVVDPSADSDIATLGTVKSRSLGGMVTGSTGGYLASTGISVSRSSPGLYTIVHNLGHANYAVLLTTYLVSSSSGGNARHFAYYNKTTVQFQVVCRDGDGTLQDASFDFSIVVF